jgi:hypothetical protein
MEGGAAVNKATVGNALNNLVLLFLLMFGAPLAISILLLQANWQEIAIAFAAWWAILFVFLGGAGRRRPRRDEIVGWMMIFTMFTGWIGVPVLVAIQQLVS